MTRPDPAALALALDALPQRLAGPGGVAGVVHEGVVIAARAWGYADLAQAVPMQITTRLPICSISKQFTCQLLHTLPDRAALGARIARFLPAFEGQVPSLEDLCNNQSGLRDYWALTVLQGATPEQTFARADALPLIARMRTGHFAPGTAYSYCNANYRILGELIEEETGTPIETLYRRAIWGPAGMETACLTPDTRHPADGVTGYEGTPETGFFPASNGIYWFGDAGISAALEDMLAYERWIDATRLDPQSLYRQISAPPRFADGRPAAYGQGLAHHHIAGLDCTGHGGALRGFRAHRLHAGAARLSVVVMLNHEADAFAAAKGLIEAAQGVGAPAPRPVPRDREGRWRADDGLFVQLSTDHEGALMRYAGGTERLGLSAGGDLTAAGITLRRTAGGGLEMIRARENRRLALHPVRPADPADAAPAAAEIAGRYACDELGAELAIDAQGGAAYARFSGMLGAGAMERMARVGHDLWLIATPRSMDAPAPGDWTVGVTRDAAGQITGLEIGCWLARGLRYRRIA